MSLTTDPKVLIARRCFRDAQSLLQSAPISEVLAGTWETGWYDTTLSPEVGSFALVSPTGALASLVGKVIRVIAGERACFVYVVASSGALTTPLALQRRAFLSLALLSRTSIPLVVELVS
jgi:hypothetical protein